MALTANLVSQIEISSDPRLFFELIRYKPYEISTICPALIQSCELLEGDWGTVGSVFLWKYFEEGKSCVAKEVVEAINEEKMSLTYKVIEGDLLVPYTAFKLVIEVDTTSGKNIVTWTLEHEKLNPDVPDPTLLMDFCLAVTKEIDAYLLLQKPAASTV